MSNMNRVFTSKKVHKQKLFLYKNGCEHLTLYTVLACMNLANFTVSINLSNASSFPRRGFATYFGTRAG